METVVIPPRKNRRRKAWLLAGTIVVLVLGAVELRYWLHQRGLERLQAEDDVRAEKIIAKAAESKDYNKAREEVAADHFSLDTIKRAVTTEIRRQMIKRVNGYFEQETEQERTKYLDGVIDEAVVYHRLAATSRPTLGPPATPTLQGKGAFVDWLSKQPAMTRASLAEFGAAFNARLTQRGLPRMNGPVE